MSDKIKLPDKVESPLMVFDSSMGFMILEKKSKGDVSGVYIWDPCTVREPTSEEIDKFIKHAKIAQQSQENVKN